ncbi:MAG: ankyrin repeat domain-containing protein [Phycisphaerales bacterium]
MNRILTANRLTCCFIAAALCLPHAALAQNAPPASPAKAPPATNPAGPTGAPPVVDDPAVGKDGSKNQGGKLSSKAPPSSTGTARTAAPPPALAANPQNPQASAPVIAFEPAVLDLGELMAEVSKTGSITVKNISDKPVKIVKIVPGCGCTTTSAPPGPLDPGASAKVDITLKPPAKAGQKVSKNVSFQIEDHAPQVLMVEGYVKEFVNIQPDMMDAPSSENPAPTPVNLTSKDNTKFAVTGAVPDVFVTPLPASPDLKQTLQLDWAKWTTAGKPAKVSILTNHPHAAQITLLIKRSLKDAQAQREKAVNVEAAPPVVLAARAGDAAKVAELLKGGAVVDAVDGASRRTALHFAADSGNVEVIKVLLAANASPNTPDRTGKTPLTLAAEKKQAKALELLIAAKGNLEARDQVQGTPLLWAAGLGSPDTVKLLLDAGANPNVSDVNGMTPLIWAATIGSPQVVELLVAKGAQIDVHDKTLGDTPLMRALRSGKPETVAILLKKGAKLDTKNNPGMTPFLVACANGSVDKIKMLIDAGADKTAKDNRGWGAIDFARNRVDPQKDAVIAFLEPIVPASTAAAPPQVKTAAPPAGNDTKTGGNTTSH